MPPPPLRCATQRVPPLAPRPLLQAHVSNQRRNPTNSSSSSSSSSSSIRPSAARTRATAGGGSSDASNDDDPSAAAAATTSSNQPPQPQTRAELEAALALAVAAEDYSEAARLKALLDAADPLVALSRQLAAAVGDERYADAARLRDQIAELKRAAGDGGAGDGGGGDTGAGGAGAAAAAIGTTSTASTRGVVVTVTSKFVPSQSLPAAGRYFFAYRVRIRNEGSSVVMLRSRCWRITDANGRADTVRGPGVVGQQPVLRPGAAFEYESACPLPTPRGRMEGEYRMEVLDGVSGEWGGAFDAAVAPFALDAHAEPRRPDE